MKTNLKLVLMDLGNRLVTKHGFNPASHFSSDHPSTKPIKDFTDFLNQCPEAQEELADMGIDYPTVK